jgi:phosphoribosylanthranilate isomerase
MLKPDFITFTGVDDYTSIDRMKFLSKKYPIEWGILTGWSMPERMPSKNTIKKLLKEDMNFSLHLCGKDAKSFKEGSFKVPKEFKRIQVNGKIKDLKDLEEKSLLINKKIIIQQKDWNNETKLMQLFDTSGGRGLRSKTFPLHPGYFVGYSGGIGPDNVLEILKEINSSGKYWIDMETNIRTNDRFDLDKVELVCKLVYEKK